MATTPTETIEITSETVACDGGGGALGHPKVYLNLGDKDQIDCPYCGRRFKIKQGTKRGGGH